MAYFTELSGYIPATFPDRHDLALCVIDVIYFMYLLTG